MKKFCAVLCVLGMLWLAIAAFPPRAAAWTPAFTFSSRVWSEYVGSNGAVVHNAPVLQSELFIGLPRGFYADVWHSAGLNDADLSSDFGDEIDYALGWASKIWKLDIDISVAYFDLFHLGVLRGDIIQPRLEASRMFKLNAQQLITPFTRIEFPFPARGDSPDNGVFWHTGIRHQWNIRPGVLINNQAKLTVDTGAYGFDNGLLANYNGALVWRISPTTTLEFPAFTLSTPITPLSDDRKTSVAVGVGVVVNF